MRRGRRRHKGNGNETIETAKTIEQPRDTEAIQARIAEARKRAKGNGAMECNLSLPGPFDGVRSRDAGLLELDARQSLGLNGQEKADLLGVARKTVYRIRARYADWDVRVAARSLQVLDAALPVADAGLTQDLLSSDRGVANNAREQLYRMKLRIKPAGTSVNLGVLAGSGATLVLADVPTNELLKALAASQGHNGKDSLTALPITTSEATSHNIDYVNLRKGNKPQRVTALLPQSEVAPGLDSPVTECQVEATQGEATATIEAAPEPQGCIERVQARREATCPKQDMAAARAAITTRERKRPRAETSEPGCMARVQSRHWRVREAAARAAARQPEGGDPANNPQQPPADGNEDHTATQPSQVVPLWDSASMEVKPHD